MGYEEYGDKVIDTTAAEQVQKGYYLKHRDDLLLQLGLGLSKFSKHSLGNLEVQLVMNDGQVYSFSVHQFIELVSQDLYWDERGNWAEASRLRVVSL